MMDPEDEMDLIKEGRHFQSSTLFKICICGNKIHGLKVDVNSPEFKDTGGETIMFETLCSSCINKKIKLHESH